MQRVSSAELRKLRMTKLVILEEQSQFGHKQLPVRAALMPYIRGQAR